MKFEFSKNAMFTLGFANEKDVVAHLKKEAEETERGEIVHSICKG